MLQEQHSEHQQTITPLSNIPASALPAPSGIPMKKSSIPSAGSALPVFSTPKRQIGQLTQPKVIYSHNQSQQSLSASSQLYSNDTKTSGNLFNIDNLYTIHQMPSFHFFNFNVVSNNYRDIFLFENLYNLFIQRTTF